MQDYKMLVRTVWGGATMEGENGAIIIQNVMEAQDYLSSVYLSNGYTILSVDYLGEFILNPEDKQGSPQGPRFAWHLVKDVK